MEGILDANIHNLRNKIASYCDRGEVFDLKKLLHFYTIDVLGELAFSESFSIQTADDESLAPPVKEHSLLAAMTGAWPAMTMSLKKWLPLVPIQELQRLFMGRAACAQLASRCVQRRLSELRGVEVHGKSDGSVASGRRPDLLTSLILAEHPDTGEKLAPLDLETEAFGFM